MNPYLLIGIKHINITGIPNSTDLVHYLPFMRAMNLVKNLPHRSQVSCALKASKSVLYVWEDFMAKKTLSNSLSIKQKEAPKKAIETIENWLEGKATIEEVKKSIDNTMVASSQLKNHYSYSDYGKAAQDASFSAISIIYLGSGIYNTDNTESDLYDFLRDAIHAAGHAVNREVFYKDWWDSCYPLIQKEIQVKYDIFCKEIRGGAL